jgi:hypothetical protein
MSANKVMWLGRLFYDGLAGLMFLMIATAGPLFLRADQAIASVFFFSAMMLIVPFFQLLPNTIGRKRDGIEIFHVLTWCMFAWIIGEIVFWHLMPNNSMTLSIFTAVICSIVGGIGMGYLDLKHVVSNVFERFDIGTEDLIIHAWFWDFIILAALPMVALVLF